MAVTCNDPWGWSMYSFSSDEVIALRGHTLELGCSSMTFSNGETGRPRSDWTNFAFGISTNTTNPTSARLYSDISEESSVWNEKLTCCTFTVPDNATALTVGFKSYGFPKGTILTVKEAYLYDLKEEVSIRGRDATNASLRVCRVNEEQELATPSNFRNTLYFTEKGRIYCYDLKGTKVDIAGSVYAGAVEAGYADSPSRFGLDIYKLMNGDIGGNIEDLRLLPIPTAEDEGKILQVVNGKWVVVENNTAVDPVPDNVVLFEESDEEDSVIDVESLIKNNLTLDADDEFLYLLYGEEQISKVPMAGSGNVVYCTGIRIQESDQICSIENIGALIALSVFVSPSGCTQTVRWSSSDPTVAEVTSDGTVKVVGEGTAIITAKCGSYSSSINVSVKNLNVKSNIAKNASWINRNGTPWNSENSARAYSYVGSTEPFSLVDTEYAYGIPLEQGIKYTIRLNTEVADGCYYGVQVFSSVSKTRIADSGWQTPGTEYNYTPTEDGLCLYVNFKYGAAGSATITDEILEKLRTGFSIRRNK